MVSEMRNPKRSAAKVKKVPRSARPRTSGRSPVTVRELRAAMADALEDILRYELRCERSAFAS